MNERIRELAEQATKRYPATESSGEFSTFDREKFAELIVQECADVCERFGESGDGYTCSAEILEHFGVEE
jgi:hypothetical protein